MSEPPLISIIIPVYNEDEVLTHTLQSLEDVLSNLGDYSFEILLIDDGSSDDTRQIIREKAGNDSKYKGIFLSRNFGQQAAISARLRKAKGEAVVIMDADMQNPPALITEFIQQWEAGYDVVYGQFQERNDSLFKRITSWLFYNIFLKLTSIRIPKNASDFSLMSRSVVDELNCLPETNRFIRGLRAWVGYEQTAVPYEKPEREDGTSHYSFTRLLKLALDGILSFSIVPLRMAIALGILISLIGFGYNIFIIGAKLFGETPIGWASLASIDLILGGIELIVLGIVGEYIGRIYDEVKQRPNFIIEDEVDNSPEHTSK